MDVTRSAFCVKNLQPGHHHASVRKRAIFRRNSVVLYTNEGKGLSATALV
jgi:hypothetical protein